MTIVIVVHILVCVALIMIVLLQAGKGAEMGAAFGGASQTIFGVPGHGISFQTDYRRCGYFYDYLASSNLLFNERGSTIMKDRPAPTAPAAPSGMPVQPQVPVPEPKK